MPTGKYWIIFIIQRQDLSDKNLHNRLVFSNFATLSKTFGRKYAVKQLDDNCLVVCVNVAESLGLEIES